jgi:DNA repair ATPase RecN
LASIETESGSQNSNNGILNEVLDQMGGQISDALTHLAAALQALEVSLNKADEKRSNSDKKIDDLIVTLREIADNSVNSEEDPTIGPSKELEALTILIGGQEKLLERLLIESDNSEMRMNLRNIDTNLLRALEELPLNYREATDGLKNELGKIVEAIELIDRSKSDTEASSQSRKD